MDGEIVALDEGGRTSFNALQNYGSPKAPILYYVFDVLILAGRNVMGEKWINGASLWNSGFLAVFPIRFDIRRRWKETSLM
jgi:hypothetical protein